MDNLLKKIEFKDILERCASGADLKIEQIKNVLEQRKECARILLRNPEDFEVARVFHRLNEILKDYLSIPKCEK